MRYASVVRSVRAVLAQYPEMRLTLRQIYYRLIDAGGGIYRATTGQTLPNRLSTYQGLSRNLVQARKVGDVPWDAIEDRTRSTLGGFLMPIPFSLRLRRLASKGDFSPEKVFREYYDFLSDLGSRYELPRTWGQPFYVQAWVEKQALAAIFSQVTDAEGVDLAVCRGYPSATFLKESAEELLDVEGRDLVVLYFGDFDPSGADIERYVRETLEEFNVEVEFRRVAITRQQIEEYRIPPAPAKRSDARYESFVAREGVAWQVELDAIEPRTLQGIIRDSLRAYVDAGATRRRSREQRERREKIQGWLDEAFNDEFTPPEVEE